MPYIYFLLSFTYRAKKQSVTQVKTALRNITYTSQQWSELLGMTISDDNRGKKNALEVCAIDTSIERTMLHSRTISVCFGMITLLN